MALGDGVIRAALARLAEVLRVERDVEILIVGGAAGILTKELPPLWTTSDVDMIDCQLPEDREAVLTASEQVARELSLPPSWMSEDVGLYAWTLPFDWKARRRPVCQHRKLHVYAVARVDLIAMKFLAHRAVDLEHLDQLLVKADELKFVVDHLKRLEAEHPEEIARIEMARAYVKEWKV